MSAKIRNYIIAGLICLFSFLLIHSVQVIYSNVLLGVGIEKNTEGQYVISEISASEEGYKQNLRLGDIIVQVNGVDVELADKVVRYNVLAQVQSVDIIRTSNEGNSIHMHVNIKNEYSLYHKFTQLVVPGVTLLFLMILSLFLYRKRAGERSAELLILFF